MKDLYIYIYQRGDRRRIMSSKQCNQGSPPKDDISDEKTIAKINTEHT
jgi:hypothetical protein